MKCLLCKKEYYYYTTCKCRKSDYNKEIKRLRDGYSIISEKVEGMDGYESQRLSVIKEIGKILSDEK